MMRIERDFRIEGRDNEDNDPHKSEFLEFLYKITCICNDKKADAEIIRLTKLFALTAYSFAKNTKAVFCLEHESDIMQLTAVINYPKKICVGFDGIALKDLSDLVKVSTRVIMGSPEFKDEDVMLIFERDMK